MALLATFRRSNSATPNEIGALGSTGLTTGELAVYDGRGDGTLGSGSFYAGGGFSPAPALSAGDFTGDGNIDLLTSDMTLFRGSQNGIFKASRNTISTTPLQIEPICKGGGVIQSGYPVLFVAVEKTRHCSDIEAEFFVVLHA